MNNDYDILDKAVKTLSESPVPQGPSDDLVWQTLEQIEQTKTTSLVERILHMKPIIKIAATAVILIGVSAIFLFPSGGQSIALATVYDKVLQAQAFMYKMSMTMTGSMAEGMPAQNMEMEAMVTISNEYGMKMENTTHLIDQNQTIDQQMYIIPDEKVMMMVIPSEKKFTRMEFSDDLLEKMKKQNNDPREMIKHLLNCNYAELERTEINGITVQGFQTTDPGYSGGAADNVTTTLWIDVDTWLPVRSEFSMKMGSDGQIWGVIEDFQWNIDVDAALFKPVIPDDYKEFGSMKLPEMTEKAAIEGLTFFAELAGAFPKKLDIVSLMNETMGLRNSQTDAAVKIREKIEAQKTEEERAAVIMEIMKPVQSLGMFYMTLVQGKKDPAYYGERVMPDDVDAVLMRWKTDNGKYKVIFGDLSSVEMEYKDLIKIELPAEPNSPPTDTAQP